MQTGGYGSGLVACMTKSSNMYVRTFCCRQMVTEAILALKERNGSSVQAIKKHIVGNHRDLTFAPHQLRSALKKGTESGKYIKVSQSLRSIMYALALCRHSCEAS